jgi:hypothetical protein
MIIGVSKGLVSRLRRRIANFLILKPNVRRLITLLGITSVTIITVFSVYYESDIQARKWEFWVLIGLALIAGLAHLQPLILGRAGIDLSSFSEITRELRHAIMMIPVEGEKGEEMSEWTFDEWKQRFDLVANLIERQVDGLLRLGKDEGVACNLMVVLPNNLTHNQLEKVAELDDEYAQVVAPYKEDNEGISSESDITAILFMSGRGQRARTRGYPWIYLRVPVNVNKCLPGAPVVYHQLLHTQGGQLQPPYEYLQNPQNVSKTQFKSGVNQDAKNAFAGYFTTHQAHVASFISIGLLWADKQPIGILNIDSRQKEFLDNLDEQVTIDLLTPYSEIAVAFAYMYRQRLTKWLEDSQ